MLLNNNNKKKTRTHNKYSLEMIHTNLGLCDQSNVSIGTIKQPKCNISVTQLLDVIAAEILQKQNSNNSKKVRLSTYVTFQQLFVLHIIID